MKRFLTMSFALLAPAVLAAADETAAVPKPAPATPAYTPVRWNEDYSYLKDPALRTDPFDVVKYIPFNESGSIYLSLAGQARERYEYFKNNNFGAGAQDANGYFLTRGLFSADLHAGPVRVFGQLKTSMEDARVGGPRASDSDEIDVQQLFADLQIPLGDKNSTTLRFGRQDLLYGAERLISPLDWTNVRRTFEGGKVSTVLGAHTIDAFWVRPVIVDNEHPNDGDGNTSFAGVYDTIALPEVFEKAGTKLELYGLVLNKTKAPAVATAPAVGFDSDTYTVGFRFASAPKPWDIDVEADYQFGQSGTGNISAWSFAVEGGYTLLDCPLKPRGYLGFDIASGDDNAAKPDSQRFNQLFPLGHAYFGYIDVIGRQNIVDLHPGVELTLLENQSFAKKIALRTDYHIFWRQNENDGVFNAAGGLLRSASGSHEMFVGSELDLLLRWQIDRHLSTYVGYSHFFPGDFINNTGPHADIDFFYASASFTF